MVIISARPAIAAALASCYAQHPISAKVLSPGDDWSNHAPGDLVVFDTVGFPRSLDRLAEFTAMAPDIRRVAVLSYPSDLAALLARRAGANAVITESESADEWKTVLDRVSLESFIVSATFGRAPSLTRILTNRQREVYVLAARGYSDEAIAAQLGTSISTAETHRRDAQAKLCCAGHHELLLHAIRHGIVTAAEVDLRPLNRKATRRHSRESIAA